MPEILSAAELLERYSAELDTRRTWLTDGFTVGPVAWDPDGVIEIQPHEYWIDWGRINTPNKLVEWCEHLREKTWFDAEHLGAFVTVWLEVYRLKGGKRRPDTL